MKERSTKLWIRKASVAIMSVFLVLIMVTAIVYDTVYAVNMDINLHLTTSETNFSAKNLTKKSVKKSKPIQKPDINAGAFMVMSGSTSEVVYSSRSKRKLQPGCVTKYMTAMVIIDNMYNSTELKNSVSITKELAKYGDTFKQGENIEVGDLIKAMLIGNSDQAAEALATYSASNRKIFVNEMNAKATELGLMDTHFNNPSGAYGTGQYSTAADCAIIAQAAIRYDEIKSLSEIESFKLEAKSNKKKNKSRSITLETANPLLKNKGTTYKYIQSGISGTIDYSMQIAGIARMDDMQLIVIILDGNQDTGAVDARDLFEYGYSKVARHTIVKADKKVGRVSIRGGAVTKLPVYTEAKGFAYIPPEGSTDLVKTKVVVQSDVEAPVKKGQKVGEFQIFVADELKGTVDLVIKKDVAKGWFPSKIYISNFGFVLICLFLFAMAFLVLRIVNVRRSRAKRREYMRRRKIEELARKQMALDAYRRKRDWTYSNFYDNDVAHDDRSMKKDKK